MLDQGYWSDGLYTAASDEALVYDIATMKDLGSRCCASTSRWNPLRWYYHCDRLGMLVWQDMVNGGGTYRRRVVSAGRDPCASRTAGTGCSHARTRKPGRSGFGELRRTIDLLRNCTSIAVWVPFNEGWGSSTRTLWRATLNALIPAVR